MSTFKWFVPLCWGAITISGCGDNHTSLGGLGDQLTGGSNGGMDAGAGDAGAGDAGATPGTWNAIGFLWLANAPEGDLVQSHVDGSIYLNEGGGTDNGSMSGATIWLVRFGPDTNESLGEGAIVLPRENPLGEVFDIGSGQKLVNGAWVPMDGVAFSPIDAQFASATSLVYLTRVGATLYLARGFGWQWEMQQVSIPVEDRLPFTQVDLELADNGDAFALANAAMGTGLVLVTAPAGGPLVAELVPDTEGFSAFDLEIDGDSVLIAASNNVVVRVLKLVNGAWERLGADLAVSGSAWLGVPSLEIFPESRLYLAFMPADRVYEFRSGGWQPAGDTLIGLDNNGRACALGRSPANNLWLLEDDGNLMEMVPENRDVP